MVYTEVGLEPRTCACWAATLLPERHLHAILDIIPEGLTIADSVTVYKSP